MPYLVRKDKGLSWRAWRLVGAKEDELAESDLRLLDQIADLTADVDGNFARIRDLYAANSDLAVPPEIIER